MTDCIPDTTETYCIHCGWKKPERIRGWPRRNCQKSPDFAPGAEKLGLTLGECQAFINQLAVWQSKGCPERTEVEQEKLRGLCRGVCLRYGAKTEEWPEQCLYSCHAGMTPQRSLRPPLAPLWRMATTNCPAKLWPEEKKD